MQENKLKGGKIGYSPYFENGSFCVPFRLAYQDTDMGGVVYHGRYLDYAEFARSEFVRQLGYSIAGEDSLLFVVSNLSIKYMKPVVVDNIIILKTKIAEKKKIRLTFEHNFYVNDTITTSMLVEVVAVDRNVKPIPFPEKFFKRINDLMG